MTNNTYIVHMGGSNWSPLYDEVPSKLKPRRCKVYAVCELCGYPVGFHCVVFPEYCEDQDACVSRRN